MAVRFHELRGVSDSNSREQVCQPFGISCETLFAQILDFCSGRYFTPILLRRVGRNELLLQPITDRPAQNSDSERPARCRCAALPPLATPLWSDCTTRTRSRSLRPLRPDHQRAPALGAPSFNRFCRFCCHLYLLGPSGTMV